MADDENIHAELADLEGWLGRFESPSPSQSVVEAAKARARIELDEEWLAGKTDPLPYEAALRRVRDAVRRELGVARHLRLRWSSAGSPAFGALAAAATILLAVGVGWWASSLMRPAEGLTALDDLATALETGQNDSDLQIALLEDDLDDLEAELWAAYSADEDAALDPLEMIDAELDELERESEDILGAS